jgi:hypothetical protein
VAAILAAIGETLDRLKASTRICRRAISAELAGIFEQLSCSALTWQARLEKLKGDRLLGRFFATTRAKLREISERLGVRYVVNLTGCPTR